ncbi:type VII toxin-antitoxin system HepT family RNase toxin [Brevibacillus panacihumi]|uniref:type VII toxin-antitoxin system HepT family RNase toxin n=1 Tax=Brevibacillus panacihumi TaxID=497735 RepID=UPI003D07A739
MYDVNTKRIDQVFTHMNKMMNLLEKLCDRGKDAVLADEVATAAMERGLHLSIEAVIDVGNAMIDGFIMRDPGSYSDIVEILRDEQVITEQQARILTRVTDFRKHLVNDYTTVPAGEMFEVVQESLSTLREFEPAVRTYLEKELF